MSGTIVVERIASKEHDPRFAAELRERHALNPERPYHEDDEVIAIIEAYPARGFVGHSSCPLAIIGDGGLRAGGADYYITSGQYFSAETIAAHFGDGWVPVA